MESQYKLLLWVFRVIGFILMWTGLSLLFSPLIQLLDIVPFFGDIGKSVIQGITFVVALILSAITIAISIVVHNAIALGITISILIIGGIILMKKSSS